MYEGREREYSLENDELIGYANIGAGVTDVDRGREERGGRDRSAVRLGGEWGRVGGVEPSETLDESAVDGLSSSFFERDFLRAGTFSGQVHFKAG